jgi:hypothetical protein
MHGSTGGGWKRSLRPPRQPSTLPQSRLVDAFDQVVEPLITEITCLRSHELRLFHLFSAHAPPRPIAVDSGDGVTVLGMNFSFRPIRRPLLSAAYTAEAPQAAHPARAFDPGPPRCPLCSKAVP